MNLESFKLFLQEISNSLGDIKVNEFDHISTQISSIAESISLGCNLESSNRKISSAYKTLLNAVINSPTILNSYEQSKATTDVIDRLVLQVLHVDSFFVLVSAVKYLPPSSKLDIIIILLSKFLKNGSFLQMLKEQCIVSKNVEEGQSSCDPLWEPLATYIVSLPNRISNKCFGKSKETFEMETFSKLISQSMISTLEHVYYSIQNNENSSTKFLSVLLGRLCLSGLGNSTLQNLVPQLLPHIGDFLWLRIIRRFFTCVPDKCVEAVTIPLFSCIPWYGHIESFIGDGINENITLKFLISKKLIFIRHYDSPDMLFKCIGYLAASKSRQEVFLAVFFNLLDVWSKSSALKHQSNSEHLYISRGVIICGAFIKVLCIEVKNPALMKFLLQGVQIHIENSINSVRSQGMVVGQIISSILDPHGPKLAFEFEETVETRSLFALLTVPTLLETSTEQNVTVQTREHVGLDNDVSLCTVKEAENLDSDDDLEPYDQSNDTNFQKEKTPVYVQDILDGLIDHSQPEYSCLCLETSEKIIRSQAHYTSSVAEELTKVLLHLEDNLPVNNFVSARFKALVAVTVIAPKKTAKYLTDQFYDRNYNIRQRLDILEVLAAASQELSQCNDGSQNITSEQKIISSNESSVSHNHWSEIVQKRIEAKTRRFSKKSAKEPPLPVANRFALVAGVFFFPLLKYYDKQENTLDLLGEDTYVLGRLIYTLGIICNSAANTIILRQMCKAMLDFIWTLRYHTDVFVRQSLLFALCMIVINVPPSILLGDFQSDISECQLWLQDIVQKDSNVECRKWAGKILRLIYQMIKSEQE